MNVPSFFCFLILHFHPDSFKPWTLIFALCPKQKLCILEVVQTNAVHITEILFKVFKCSYVL